MVTINTVTVREILADQASGKLHLSLAFIDELSKYDTESVVIPLPNDSTGAKVIVLDKDKAEQVIVQIKKQFEGLLQE